jgi:ABC-type multidrug transport system ATPase subunit
MITALSLRAVCKSFRLGVRGCAGVVSVLRRVNLDVHLGEIVGIEGADGAGKTTLLMCAAGMLRPDDGAVSWFGERQPKAVPPVGIGYVPERPCYYPFLSVGEALEYYATARELARGDRDARVSSALECVGLSGAGRIRISELSRCMLQRLSLAQALIERPRLLLIDDALSTIEPTALPRILALLRVLAEEGVGIVIAARDSGAFAATIERRVALVDGSLRRHDVERAPFDERVTIPSRVAERSQRSRRTDDASRLM